MPNTLLTAFPNGVSSTLALEAPIKIPVQVASANGAITLTSGAVIITKGSACLLTLAAPVATDDDGKILYILSTTAFAHTVTIANGLRGSGASTDVGTYGLAIDNIVVLVAYNGAWYPLYNLGVTFA